MSQYMRPRSVAVSALVVAVAGILVGSALAANIAGTPKNDTLRGTAKADRILGQGGDDKLYGLGGNDVLNGGPGNDLVVGGPGSDTLSCGAGRDTARGDARDRISKNCEFVTGVPAPEPEPPTEPMPPPAPTPPPVFQVTPGSYQGQTQNGNFVFLVVSANRTFTGLRVNDLPARCDSGGELTGGEDFGGSIFTIRADGTFDAQGSWDGSEVRGDIEWTHWDGRVAGRFDTATSVTGTIVMNYGLEYKGTALRCSSGEITWSATLRP
jgi:hypothetical protein